MTHCHQCPYLKKPGEQDLSNQVFEQKRKLFAEASIHFTPPSQWLAAEAQRSTLLHGFPFTVIPYAINQRIFRPIGRAEANAHFALSDRSSNRTGAARLLFGSANVTDTRKGFRYFADALTLLHQQHPDLAPEILVFGKGRSYLFNELPYPVRHLGLLTSEEDIVAAYNAADALVVPSLEDNLPNTVIEALACGTPVVGFRTGGIPEMIDHQVTGFLADTGSAQQLADGLAFILTHSNPELLRQNARQAAEAQFSEDVVAQQHINLYKEMLTEASVPVISAAGLSCIHHASFIIHSLPTLSIITITYNAERFLERTIQSIIEQHENDYEYLIIDGSSTDGTLDIIRRYESHVTTWISEPDRGLYDAMNKGLHRARGKYVWFMNAGDTLHDSRTLANLLITIKETPADVYYSDALFVQNDGTPVGLRSAVTPHALPQNLTWRDMALGMKVCHQSFIAKRSIAPDYLLKNLSADLDWEIRCLKVAQKIKFLPFTLCNYLMGGLSVQHHRRSLTDRFKVLVTHFGLLATVVNHGRILIRAYQFKNR